MRTYRSIIAAQKRVKMEAEAARFARIGVLGSAQVLRVLLAISFVCVSVCMYARIRPPPPITHTQREQGQREMQAALLRAVKLAVATLRIKQVVHSKRRAQLNDSQLIRIDAVQVFVRARAHALMHTQIWARNAVAHQHTSA